MYIRNNKKIQLKKLKEQVVFFLFSKDIKIPAYATDQ